MGSQWNTIPRALVRVRLVGGIPHEALGLASRAMRSSGPGLTRVGRRCGRRCPLVRPMLPPGGRGVRKVLPDLAGSSQRGRERDPGLSSHGVGHGSRRGSARILEPWLLHAMAPYFAEYGDASVFGFQCRFRLHCATTMLANTEKTAQAGRFPMSDRPLPDLKEIAGRLRSLMAKRGLVAEDISHLTNGEIPARTFSNWTHETKPSEAGAVKLARVAQALEVSVEYLLYGNSCRLVWNDVIDAIRALATEPSKARRRATVSAILLKFLPYMLPISHRVRNGEEHRSVVVDEDQALAYTTEVKLAIEQYVPDLKDAWNKLISQWEEVLLRVK